MTSEHATAELVPLVEGDRHNPTIRPDLPVVIVLDRLRSAFNVGNIFRLADAVGAEKIVTCGYTATPPHPKLAKTARGCDRTVPCTHAATAAEALHALRRQGYALCAAETARNADLLWETPTPFPLALVFGNEALGVTQEALALCDHLLRLPCAGTKNSINVANCAAVVLYEMRRRWLNIDVKPL